jgi:hypothetical protein
LNFAEGTVTTNGDVITVAQYYQLKSYKATILNATPNGNSDGYNVNDQTIRLTLRIKTPSPDLYNDFKYTSVVIIMDANKIVLRNPSHISRSVFLVKENFVNINGVLTRTPSTIISPSNYSSKDKDRVLELTYSQVEATSKEVTSSIPNSVLTKVTIGYNGMYLTDKEITKYKSEIEKKYKDSDVKVVFEERGTSSSSIFSVTIDYSIETPVVEQINNGNVTPIDNDTNGTQNKD